MMALGGWRTVVRALRHPLAGVLLLAVAVRLAFFLQTRDDPTFTVPLWDAAVFDEMARSVARGDGVGYPKAYFFGPLYAYLLGFLYFLSSGSSAFAIAVQHGVGVVLVGLTYLLARTWFGRREGLIAALGVALAGIEVFYEGKLLMEVWVSLLLLGAILCLARLQQRWRGGSEPSAVDRGWAVVLRVLLAGLLLGFAALGRPTALLLVPLVAFPLRSLHGRSGRPVLWLLLVFLLGASVGPGLTALRNFQVEGVWVPITSSGGFNFYLGNCPDTGDRPERARLRVDSSWDGEDSAEAALGRQLDSAELSLYWFRRSVDSIAADPGGWIGHVFDKLQTLWSGQDVPQIEVYELERSRSALLRGLPVTLHLLMALAFAGVLACLPSFRRLGLLYGVVGLYSLGVTLFFVTTRYRVAMVPYLAVFAAAFLGLLWDAVRVRSWRSLGLLVLLGLGALAFTLPSRHPIDRREGRYTQLLHDGFRLTRAGEFDRAAAAYREAQALEPGDYEGYLGLGIAFREQGDLDSSLHQLRAATERNQFDAEVPYHLGVTLHAMRLYEGAERTLRRSLEMNPRRALTHAYLGLTLAAEGRLDEARSAFERSLELDPNEAFTHNNLGVLLGMQGDLAGARRSFLRAVAEDPTYSAARRNLAQSYLESGEIGSARREIEIVLSQNPEDSVAREILRNLGGTRGPTR